MTGLSDVKRRPRMCRSTCFSRDRRPITPTVDQSAARISTYMQLASCLIYTRATNVIFIMWVRSVSKMLPSVKFAEDKVLTFLILREKC